MTKPNDAIENSSPAICYAMIVYRQPDLFTASEQATFDQGTNEERRRLLTAVCMKGFGVPARLLESGNANYSSARLDAERYANVIGRRID